MIHIINIFIMLSVLLFGDTEFAEPKPSIVNQREIVFSIKSANKDDLNHVLSSANNVLKFYGPENVHMRIIAYYHGIEAVLKKNKKIALRVDVLMQYEVEFVACRNTMDTKHIKESELIDGVEIVTSGIVELIERVKDNWVNIVP
jgi:intracellular sulfur oxidation DsrE/DsrF family protein